jgi:alpha-tubulin suppressor-like RCC1 family protein
VKDTEKKQADSRQILHTRALESNHPAETGVDEDQQRELRSILANAKPVFAAIAWRSNSIGQLGNGAADSVPHATPIRVRSDVKFIALSAGFTHTCALERDGSAWCWGANDTAQLGERDDEERADCDADSRSREYRISSCAVALGYPGEPVRSSTPG